MALHPIAGARMYIGGVLEDKNADFIESDFNGQSWIEIDGWELAGDIGDDANMITTTLINRGRDMAQKGTWQVVTNENRFAIITNDPGQMAARAAARTKSNYATRVVWEDGAESLFIGLYTAREVGGEANTIRMLQINIARNSNVVDVPAP